MPQQVIECNSCKMIFGNLDAFSTHNLQRHISVNFYDWLRSKIIIPNNMTCMIESCEEKNVPRLSITDLMTHLGIKHGLLQDFLRNNNIELSSYYTVKEIIEEVADIYRPPLWN